MTQWDKCNICGAVRDIALPCGNCETKVQNAIAKYLDKFLLTELANRIRAGEWYDPPKKK